MVEMGKVRLAMIAAGRSNSGRLTVGPPDAGEGFRAARVNPMEERRVIGAF